MIQNENVVESYKSDFPDGSLNKWGAVRVGRLTSIKAMDIQNQVSTNTIMFTLPASFAPSIQSDFPVFSRVGEFLGTIRVDTNGQVYPIFDPLKSGVPRCTFTFANHG